MNNPNMTAKERNLLKGAVRRVFSRSDLRRKVLDTVRIEHTDPKRPRVRKWGKCANCKQPTALYEMQVDHIDPIVPLHSTLEAMDWDTVVNRTWCEQKGLQVLCPPCHTTKTSQERTERTKHKKRNKK